MMLTEPIRDSIIRILDDCLRYNAIVLKDGVVIEISPESKVRTANEITKFISQER